MVAELGDHQRHEQQHDERQVAERDVPRASRRAAATAWRIDRPLADARALEHVAVRRDEGAEPRGRHLHHPAPGLDRPQAARRDLLGLQDRAGVAGAVGGVEEQPRRRARTPSRARAAEEHLPRDHHAQPGAVGHVEHRRARAGDGVVGHLVDRRAERLEQAAQRHVLAERHPPHLVVAADDRRPYGVTTTWALMNAPRPSGDVLGDADGDRHTEPARLGRDRGVLGAGLEVVDVDDVLRPDDEVEVGVGLDRAAVASRWRSVTSRLGTSRALVPCSPPPCTAAIVERSAGVVAARGDHGDGDDEHERHHGGDAAAAASGRTARHASRLDAAPPRAHADLEHDPREQDHAPDRGRCRQRAAGLGDAEAWRAARRRTGTRTATPRPACGRAGGDDRPPHARSSSARRVPGRSARRRRASRVTTGGDVARHGELPHPAHAGRQPGEGEQEPEARSSPGATASDRGWSASTEQGDADERQRPPAPRRQREGDEEARAPTSARALSRVKRRWWSSGASVVVVARRVGRHRRRLTVDREEVEVDDDALRHRARRMAGEQRGLGR